MQYFNKTYTKSIVWLLFILFSSNSLLKSQTITIDNTNFFSGIYGQGSDVAVPFKVTGCYNTGNVFQLWLSADDFATETMIGTYNGFFASFVNGIVPAATTPGTNYKLRVKSTNPAIISGATVAFEVQATGTAVRARSNPFPTSRILRTDEAFGYCSGQLNQPIRLQNQSSAGATATATIKNEITGNVQSGLTFNGSGDLDYFLTRHYYTYIVKATNGSINSTRAYFLINSPNRLGLSTDGEQQGCLPTPLTFVMGLDSITGIANNFPGTQYQISWGDGSAASVYKHCELLALNGNLSHTYTFTSCDSANVSFNVTTTLLNPWYLSSAMGGTVTQNNCDQPQVTTRAKIFKQPIARFSGIDTTCINTLVRFTNTSDPGQAFLGGVCTVNADYYWYVDGVLISDSLQQSPPPHFDYTFTTAGTHIIRLVVDNGTCGLAEHVRTICIEPVPNPDFKINGRDTIAGCAPLTFTPTNLTIANPCRPMDFEWLVYNNITGALIPAGTGIYTVTPSINAPNPTFTFLVPGDYRMRLTAANSCGVFQSNWRYVEVIDEANATIPGAVTYCNIRTIDFATHGAHRPTFNTNLGNEIYQWAVTGGTFGYIGGTGPSSQYPNIEFLDFATYNIRLIFQNDCGSDTVYQNITFNRPVTASVGPVKDSTICYDINSLQLNAAFTGLAASTVWSTTGTGNFTSTTSLNPIYTLSTPDKNSGLINLIFTVTPQGPTVCPVRRDTLIVRIQPRNTGVTSSKTICSDASVAHTPISTVSGSSFTWTSTLLAGAVTGLSANGSGNIADILTNTSATTDAIVRYTITPARDGCIGEPFELNVTIKAKPDLISVLPLDTICNNSAIGITYSTNAAGVTYIWTAALISGTATGFSSQVTPVTTTSINHTLNNTGTTNARVRYIITVTGPTGCIGEIDTLFVVVRPTPTAPNAGPDQRLCNATSALLNGNLPMVGIGTWSQIAGPAATISFPGLNSTSVTGLTADNVYTFIWSIRGSSSCPPRNDTIVIYNRPTVTTANAGANQVFCDLETTGSINLAANNNPARTYEIGQWNIFSQPTGGNGTFGNNTAANTTFTFARSGTYRLIWTISNDASACAPSRDTIDIVAYDKPVVGSITASNPNVCKNDNVTITLGSFTGVIQKWQYNSNPISDNIWVDTAVTAGSITFNNIQDTFAVRVIVQSAGLADGCLSTATSAPLTVNVAPPTNSGTTGPNATVCKNLNSGSITLTGFVGNIVRWEFSTNNGTTWTPIVTTASSIAYNNISTTTWYRAIVQSGACLGSPSTTTVITVIDPVTTANAGLDQKLCFTTTANLSGNTPATIENGTWSQVSGPNTATLSATNTPNITASALIPGTYIFQWSLANGTCPVSTDNVEVIIRPTITVANAGVDQVVCDFSATGSVNLTANINAGRTFESGIWSIASQPVGGAGSFVNANTNNTAFSFARSGIYTLVWTISNDAGCTPSTDTVLIKVYDLPVAGTITASNPNVCVGDNVTFTLSSFTGVIQKWQYNPKPINDNIWIDTAVTNTSITFAGVTDTFAVRVIVQSAGLADGCNTIATATPYTINVAPATIAGTTGPDASVCRNLNSGSITLTGFIGAIVRWESSTNNGSTWNTIASTSTSITYTNLSTTTWYRAIVQSGACLGSPSDTTIITVIDAVTPANAGVDQLLCNVTNTSITGNTPSTIETGLWTQLSGPNTAVLSSNTLPTINATSLIPGTYTFEWQIANGTCPPTKDTVAVTIRPAISIANAGADRVVCDFVTSGSVTLAANNISARPFETGVWTIINQPTGGNGSFSNNNNSNSSFSFAAAGNYQLVWSITNDAGCTPSADTVIIRVYDLPVVGTATANTTNTCQGNNITFTLGSFTGVIQKWQYNPKPINDNIWIDTAVTTPTLSFVNVQDTFAVRVIVVSAGIADGCTTSAISVPVTINVAPATIAGNTNPDATVCRGSNNGNITLTGFVGSIVRWELSTNSGASWSPIATTATTIAYTNLLATTWYRAIVQSGSCSGTPSDTTIITVVLPVTNANAGSDRQLCNQTGLILAANATAIGETGTWAQVSGPSVANFSSLTIPNPTVSNLVVGTYRFEWVIANGTCPPSRDTIEVINYPSIINIIDTVTNTYCTGQTVTLTGTPPTGGNGAYTYQWQRSVDGITWVNLTGATLPTYNFTAATTLYYRRIVNSTPCQTISQRILVIVQPPLGNNSINSNQTICTNTNAAIINGSIPTGADGLFIYNWQQSIDGGTTWTNIPGGNAQSYNPGILTQTTRFRRVVTSQFCTGAQSSTSNVVIITVNPDAEAQFTASTYIGCPPFNITSTNIITTPYPDRNNIYSWYANNVLIGTGINFPGYTITNDGDSVTIKLVVTSSFVCRNDSMEVKFYTFDQPEPAFAASDTAACGPLTINFTNNTPNVNAFNYLWNFGNGQTSTAINPPGINYATSATYGDTIYNVTLRAFTICDTLTATKQIRVKSKPKALFTPNRSTGCSPFTVTFTNNSLGSNVTYDWSFDDGSTLTTTTTGQLQHTFITGVPDTFFVKLKATNECGVDSQRFAIVVAPNTININFAVNGNEVTGCAPHTVNFINNSSGASSFRWDFGDGNTLNTFSNIDTVTHTYNLAGTFNVILQATNGCSDTTDTETIQVFEKPTVNFSANPLSACIGDSVRFTNQSTPTGIGYLWRFGDGSTSTLTNPAKIYATPGVYPVTLIASRQYNPGNACVDSITKQVSIVATQPGVFDITDTLGGCHPFTTTFINRSRPSILTTWNFGDGNTATGDSVTHTFTALGNFTVTMIARSAGGCTYQKTRQVLVQGPTGTLSYDNGFICNRPVRLQVTAANTDSIRWNFGNGVSITSTNNVIFYTYPLPGRYIPSVELIGTGGCRITLTGTDTIKVDNINAGFTSAQQRFCGYTTVGFADTSRSFFGINQYSWNFGDGNTSTQPNPQNNYTATNTWPIRLIITGNSGCTDTAYTPTFVKVDNKPVLGIISDTVACISQPITFTSLVNSVDTVNFYSWNFGNSATASTPVATYNFTIPATYIVQLIAGTTNGCFDTTEQRVTIHPRPNVTASTDVLICRGQSTQLNANGATSYAWTPFQGLSNPAIANPIANPIITTQYVVTGFNNFGCSNRDTVVVSVAQPFNIQVSGNDSICIGQQTRLSVSGATNYTWFPATGLDNATSANPIASPTVTTIYRVIGTDNFSCFADTAYVTVAVGGYPVVNLGQDRTLAAGSTFTLNPSITNGPIRNYIWSPITDLSCNNCPTPLVSVKKNVCYSLQAINAYGCAGSDTMCIKAFCESTQVFIPNTFTPDNDGINDLLVVRGTGIKLVKSFRVFNRWGQVVFERANFPPNDASHAWNGRIRGGNAASPDVYVYTCEVLCEDDTPFVYKGNVAIVK